MTKVELDDLKQFIGTMVATTEVRMLNDMKLFVNEAVSTSEARMSNNVKQFVGSALSEFEARLVGDMKQFVDARLSQTEERLTVKIDGVDRKVDMLSQKVDDGFTGIGEAIEQMNNETDKTNSLFNWRLLKLEQR